MMLQIENNLPPSARTQQWMSLCLLIKLSHHRIISPNYAPIIVMGNTYLEIIFLS